MTRKRFLGMLAASPLLPQTTDTASLADLKAGKQIAIAGINLAMIEAEGNLHFIANSDEPGSGVLIDVFHKVKWTLGGGHDPTHLVLRAAMLDLPSLPVAGLAAAMSDPVKLKMSELHSIRVRRYKMLDEGNAR